MKNNLYNATSPYLLQHADNPVHWYPWCQEAFDKARDEDKPIFLSIGYSTCHWCHVMARESFEDEQVAAILNENFISIKVDREERPDIDSVYMAVCQVFTGSGGWPMSIFMTPDQQPFYAGTYFPKHPSNMGIGFISLLELIAEKWLDSRDELLTAASEIVKSLNEGDKKLEKATDEIAQTAVDSFKTVFDRHFGGFGREPKFPTPQNLMFLIDQFQRSGDREALNMAEATLTAMYRGGLFDHIGFGFSRYSTDRYFLIPHFEKMLYDNGLLIGAYAMAYDATRKEIYRSIAECTAEYVLREMTNREGGFYSAQDADSDGEEGKFYAFEYDELLPILGEERGKAFQTHFGMTRKGNFEGKNIPNLLNTDQLEPDAFLDDIKKVYQYRKHRTRLHKDDKILTAWNAVMIWGLSILYRVSGKEEYLKAAAKADQFIQEHLYEDGFLYVSYRNEKRSSKGFLDDYAYYINALVGLYEATFDLTYLRRAEMFYSKVMEEFADENGGFYISARSGEKLIARPKETYDGAMPSGNSVMAMNMAKLYHITGREDIRRDAKKQMDFLYPFAKAYPMGYCFYLLAMLRFERPVRKLVCVLNEKEDVNQLRQLNSVLNLDVRILEEADEEYYRIDRKPTYYFCDELGCRAPSNDLPVFQN